MPQLDPIATVHSCFTEKFGIPRQSGLAPGATAVIEFHPPYTDPAAFTGLEGVSHLWVQFIFHAAPTGAFRPRVRPPRLGGNKTLGVFATRSPVRPNRLGLSVVKLEQIELDGGKARLHITGHDFLDGTPVLDVKPYVPYTDSLPAAQNDVAPGAPPRVPVRWTPQAREQCREHSHRLGRDLAALIEQLLAQDPRPQYQTPDPARRYAMTLLDLDVAWHYWLEGETHGVEVVGVRRPTSDVRRLTVDG